MNYWMGRVGTRKKRGAVVRLEVLGTWHKYLLLLGRGGRGGGVEVVEVAVIVGWAPAGIRHATLK